MEVIVEFHACGVRLHLTGHVEHRLGIVIANTFYAHSLSRMDDLQHLLVEQPLGISVSHQQISLCVEHHAHSIERHIPHGFLPPRLAIVHHISLDAGGNKISHYSFNTFCVRAGVVAQTDAP